MPFVKTESYHCSECGSLMSHTVGDEYRCHCGNIQIVGKVCRICKGKLDPEYPIKDMCPSCGEAFLDVQENRNEL